MNLSFKAAIILSAIGIFTASIRAEEEHHKSFLADFLVYTDESGLIYYEFDQKLQTHEEAIDICAAAGLRLMTKNEAKRLEKELEADELKIEKWLNGEKYIRVWTSSPHYRLSDLAWFFHTHNSDSVYYYFAPRDSDKSVRCVAI